jgi:hypothetical protein
MPRILVTSTYRKQSTQVLAKPGTTQSGRACLRVSDRALRAAEARCSYAGDDGIDPGTIAAIPGYTPWQRSAENGLICWAL